VAKTNSGYSNSKWGWQWNVKIWIEKKNVEKSKRWLNVEIFQENG
jgi:hypothetical protein